MPFGQSVILVSRDRSTVAKKVLFVCIKEQLADLLLREIGDSFGKYATALANFSGLNSNEIGMVRP